MTWPKAVMSVLFFVAFIVATGYAFSQSDELDSRTRSRSAGQTANAGSTSASNGGAVPPTVDPTRIPPDVPVPAPPSRTPLGVAYGETYEGDEFFSYLEELGVRATKISVDWDEIEPQNDVWTFDIIDPLLDQIGRRDDVLIAVYTSSEWGAEGVGKGYPPLDQQEYYEFIYTLVDHCQGKIKYWQRDSEPATPNHWSADRAADYVLTQETFYDAIKAADPQAKVVGLGHPGSFDAGVPASKTFYEYLLYHGRDYFDMVDVRLYLDPYSIPERIQWFRDKMTQFGYSKPIICTEYGGPHPEQFEGFLELRLRLYAYSIHHEYDSQKVIWSYINRMKSQFEPEQQMFLLDPPPQLEAKHDRIQNRDLAQRTILALSSGLERIWYWDLFEVWHSVFGPHPIFGKLCLVDLETGIRQPVFHAYKKMQWLLEGFTAIETLDAGHPDIFFFKIDRGDRGDLYVAWEKRDPFTGEDFPPVLFNWTFPWSRVGITDLLGLQYSTKPNGIASSANGVVTLELTDTPIFVQERR